MPYFRGVEIFIVAGSDAKKLPEYPHPDGSSVRIVGVGAGPSELRAGSQMSQHSLVSNNSSVDPTRQKKVNPRISVYIPSSPGDQFRLRYLINQTSLPSRYIFFKMYINRHHTVSWGIDSDSCSTGSVSRSLYEPDYLYGGRHYGIESRYFHFMHGLDKKSIAEDGGVIEIQVFRCRGRRRVATELNQYPHRYQERYGITSPSGGLVDNPHDATFYEYHLEDARDSPYATFCFHYRSMKYLEQLNIIPQQDIRLQPTCTDPTSLIASESQGDSSCTTSPTSPHQFTFGIDPLDTRVFEGDEKAIDDKVSTVPGASGANRIEEYSLTSPPQLSPSNATSGNPESRKLEQTSESMVKLLHRPLPDLPKTHSRSASSASSWSTCSSLTPSLKQYVEGDEFEEEEIQLCTAQSAVMIQSESMQVLDTSHMNYGDGDDNSCSDYEALSNSSETSQSPVLPSPSGYVSTTGSVLEHDLDQWDSPIAQSSPKSTTKLPTTKSEGDLFGDKSFLSPGTLKFTESEWLKSTPSPQSKKNSLFKRLWSPRPEARSSRSSLVEFFGRDSSDSRSGKGKKSEDSRYSNRSSMGNLDDTRKGNWI